MSGDMMIVPVGPSRRKVQALQCLGWSLADMARDFGMNYISLQESLRRENIRFETASKVHCWYRTHHAHQPFDSPQTRRIRARAIRKGWLPPAAWENIETGARLERPATNHIPQSRLDPLEVAALLQGDWKRRLSRPEKVEALRLWLAEGNSENSLCRLTGWRGGRYRDFQDPHHPGGTS